MRKKKNRRVVLNHRDREFFNYLYQVKVATARQIRRDVFDDVSLTVIYRRLKKLIGKKYVQRIPFFDGKRNISAFSLSKTGFRKFIFYKHKWDADFPNRCLSSAVEHDVILNNIRHLFLSCEEIEDYFTENVLDSNASFVKREEFKGCREMRCDGMAILKREGKNYYLAVEYEHTLKYNSRYYHLFDDYHSTEGIDAVLYICRDKKMMKKIIEVEKKGRGIDRKGVYFTTLDELFSDSKELVFHHSREKARIKII